MNNCYSNYAQRNAARLRELLEPEPGSDEPERY
jgi:hypothetical protein